MSKKEHHIEFPHPGSILKSEYMDPLEMTTYRLAKNIGVQQINLSRLLKGKMSVSVEMAFRLSRFFGTGPELWLGLQQEYDIRQAEKTISKRIEQTIKPLELHAA